MEPSSENRATLEGGGDEDPPSCLLAFPTVAVTFDAAEGAVLQLWQGADDVTTVQAYRFLRPLREAAHAGSSAPNADEVRMTALGKYAAALDAFLRGGHSLDAAYVAERVLSVDELESYVKQVANDAELNQRDRGDTRREIGGFSKTDWLRYLLARRLARLKQWDRARPYYPERWRQTLDAFRGHLALGGNENLPDRRRAEHLFRAAKLARHKGMELMGTEFEPDWSSWGGNYQLGEATKKRFEDKPPPPGVSSRLMAAVTGTSDEKQRTRRHAPSPDRRWHYRTYAAELMWRAAKLAPDNDDLTALALWHGGVWVGRYQGPDALRFHKALVIRCRNHPVGRDAERRHWFPRQSELEALGLDLEGPQPKVPGAK